MRHNDLHTSSSEIKETQQPKPEKKSPKEILAKARALYERNRSKVHDGVKKAGVAVSVVSALARPMEAEQPKKNRSASEFYPQTSISGAVDSTWKKKDVPTYLSDVIQGEGNDIANQYEHILEKRQERIEEEKDALKEEKKSSEAGDDPKSKKFEDKIQEIDREPLSKENADSFLNGEYRTVVTTEDMVLYRVYGGGSTKEGNPNTDSVFLTSHEPKDRILEKTDSALTNKWQGEYTKPDGSTDKKLPNTREYYCEVYVPKGTRMNIGKVAPQETSGGQILEGGGEQIIAHREGLKFGKEHSLDFWGNYDVFEGKAKIIEERK